MQKALATAPPRQHFGFLFQAHLAYSCCASQHLGLWQRSAPFLKARSTLVQMAPRADADVVPMRTRARKSTAPKKPYFPPLPCGKILVGILPTTRAVPAAASLDRRTALRLRLRVVSRGRVGRCASPRMDAPLARHSPSKAVSLLTRPPRCGDSQRACQAAFAERPDCSQLRACSMRLKCTFRLADRSRHARHSRSRRSTRRHQSTCLQDEHVGRQCIGLSVFAALAMEQPALAITLS